MTVSSPTQYQVLPTQKVRVIAAVFSDEPIRWLDGFFNGVVGSKNGYWTILDTIGDKGIRIASDWFEVPATSSIEERFSKFNPGFYPSNSNLTIQVAS